MYEEAPGFRPGPRVMTRAQARGDRVVLSIVDFKFCLEFQLAPLQVGIAVEVAVGDTRFAVVWEEVASSEDGTNVVVVRSDRLIVHDANTTTLLHVGRALEISINITLEHSHVYKRADTHQGSHQGCH